MQNIAHVNHAAAHSIGILPWHTRSAQRHRCCLCHHTSTTCIRLRLSQHIVAIPMAEELSQSCEVVSRPSEDELHSQSRFIFCACVRVQISSTRDAWHAVSELAQHTKADRYRRSTGPCHDHHGCDGPSLPSLTTGGNEEELGRYIKCRRLMLNVLNVLDMLVCARCWMRWCAMYSPRQSQDC